MKKLFVILVISLFITGFSSPPGSFKRHKLQGNIKNGVYFHPRKIFSFTIPKMQVGEKFEEQFIDNKSMVIIWDDLGHLVRVETTLLANENLSEIMNELNSASPEITYPGLFHHCVTNPIAQQFPGTQLIDGKLIPLEEQGSAYAGILEIPRGSTLCSAETGEHADSKRAFMLFFSGNHFVRLSVQAPFFLQIIKSPSEVNQYLFDHVIELAKSYKNIKELKK